MQRSELELGISDHYGFARVNILQMTSEPGRRLSEDPAVLAHVRFEGIGAPHAERLQNPDTLRLGSVLQSRLEAVGSGLVVTVARVGWEAATEPTPTEPTPTEQAAPESGEATAIVISLVLGAAVLGAVLTITAFCVRRHLRLRKKGGLDAMQEATTTATVVAVPEAEKKTAPPAVDSDVASVSTDTPPSEGAETRSCGSLQTPEEGQSCAGA